MLEPGARAPAFTLLDQDGEKVKLADLKGRTVVLYFYPKAATPGCTTQACGVRDNKDAYAEHDVVVLGVSPDPPEKLKRFHEDQGLNFTLLSDPEHKIADKYGTWVEKSMYGRTYMGVARATFIIDATGKVAHVFPKVQPKQHDELVLKALEDLSGAAT